MVQQKFGADGVIGAGLGAGEFCEQKFAWASRYASTTKGMSPTGVHLMLQTCSRAKMHVLKPACCRVYRLLDGRQC